MSQKIKLAFCLFEFVPFGGMQDNLLRIARECIARGHEVEVFARYWEAELPEDLKVTIFPGRGLTNHRRCESFAKRLNEYLERRHFSAIVGFNKMPGLDVYYAADTCFAAKSDKRGFWYSLTRRCKIYSSLEAAVFSKGSSTQILLLSEKEKQAYMEYYGTEEQRFHLLPPGISRNRVALDYPDMVRAELRRELSISPGQDIVLMVGSGFRTKGVDRSIKALAALPDGLHEKTILLIVGDDNKRPFERLASRLGVEKQVIFLGGREDVNRFFAAADLLLHPAYQENTGTVLIEAMVLGIPVLATDICGYAHHIEKADAGMLVPSPFQQETLNQMLVHMLTSERRLEWGGHGQDYVAKTDIFSRPERAADIIEKVAGC